jgi:hypothetical protein
LVCLSGPQAGQEIELDREVITVGRAADAGVRLEDQYASRQHAEILHSTAATRCAICKAKTACSSTANG